MYAIIRTGGKQYRVKQGDVLLVEKIGTAGEEHAFEDVLLVSDGADAIQVGRPNVAGASVKATVLGEQKAKKILVFKKKRRKGYKRKRGHRQTYSRVRIDAING